jgi:NTE family protein
LVNNARRSLVPAVAVALLCVSLLFSASATAAQSQSAGTGASRPKIGLVLSGGGARGLTHIGVLKVLEELRVPIDFIAATSMGAIVGGLSATGMSATEMERRLAEIDWTKMFSDSPPRRDLDIRRKDEDERYPIPVELGFRDGRLRFSKGAIEGGNLELYLHEITRPADDIASFDALPTPFRAIATDMVTGNEVVFDRGPLYLALRASMSVPGVFAPVEVDGQIFGDGGLVDNLPVDVMRRMGADIIIAVNIATPLMSREQLSSLVGLTAQTINILTKQNVRASLALLKEGQDVLISPDLGSLTYADFTSAAKFIELGEEAARSAAPALAAYALSPEAYREYLAQRRSMPGATEPIIAQVRVEGTERDNPAVLKAQLESQAGKPFNSAVVDADMSRLYGMGDFERVTYRLIDEQGQRDLVFDVTEKSWGPNFLRFGLNMSSDMQGETFFNFLIGHKKTWLNSLGGQWANEVEFGQIRRYSTEWYQPLELKQRFFSSVYGEIRREPAFIYDGDVRVAEYDVLIEQGGVDFGVNLGAWGEVRLGPQYTHYRADPQVALRTFPVAKLNEAGISLRGQFDQLDDPFFPRHGLRLEAEYFRGLQSIGSDTDVTRQRLQFVQALPIASNDSLQLGGRFGATNRRDETQATDFNLGGFLNVSGLRTDQLNGDYLGFVRAVYYHKMGPLRFVGRTWYLGGSLEFGNVWRTRDEVSFGDAYKAGSVFLAADTYVGPFYFAYGRTNRGESSWYLFVGRP